MLYRLGVAAAIGLLLGFERGWQEREAQDGSRTAGIRTLGLSSLLGGVLAISIETYGTLLVSTGLLVLALVVLLSRFIDSHQREGVGVTTEVAVLLAYALGVQAVVGKTVVVVAVAVATVVLLAVKKPLHSWVRRITWIEVRAALIVLTMTFIVLPLLPNRTIDSWSVFNPRLLWSMTVIVAAVSYAGYAIIKIMGPARGIAIAGLAGGLASSTAVTFRFSSMARQEPENLLRYAVGILLASAVMLPRMIFICFIISPALLKEIAVPLGVASLFVVVAALLLQRSLHKVLEPATYLPLRNPFELLEVLRFGTVLTVVLVFSQLVGRLENPDLLLLFSFLAGFGNVDAVVVSLSEMAGTIVGTQVAVLGIAVAAVANTLFKIIIAWWVGGWRLGIVLAVVNSVVVVMAAVIWKIAPPLSF